DRLVEMTDYEGFAKGTAFKSVSPAFKYEPVLDTLGTPFVDAPWHIGEGADDPKNIVSASMFKLALDLVKRLGIDGFTGAGTLGWPRPLRVVVDSRVQATEYNQLDQAIQIAKKGWRSNSVLHEMGHA